MLQKWMSDFFLYVHMIKFERNYWLKLVRMRLNQQQKNSTGSRTLDAERRTKRKENGADWKAQETEEQDEHKEGKWDAGREEKLENKHQDRGPA